MENTNRSNLLIAYFSRADENYGVGYISKGNTEIVAEAIAKQTQGELWAIQPLQPYPQKYDECIEVAKKEKKEKARPQLKGDMPEVANYETIFLGYPNWWGDMPMPVYTFLESGDFSGKTIIPFCTHGGSGLSSTEKILKKKFPQATILEGLAIWGDMAQKNRQETEALVIKWLEQLGLGKK